MALGWARPDHASMTKRLILAPVWFVSVWMTYGLVAYFIGIPDTGGAVLGALVAGSRPHGSHGLVLGPNGTARIGDATAACPAAGPDDRPLAMDGRP